VTNFLDQGSSSYVIYQCENDDEKEEFNGQEDEEEYRKPMDGALIKRPGAYYNMYG